MSLPGQQAAPQAGRDLTLALLASRVSELSGRVGELTARLETAEAAIKGQAQTAAEAASLAQEVTRLSEAVARAADTGEGERDPLGHPRIWAGMDQQTYAEALRDLARWVVEILLPRYPQAGPVLAPCWPAHPAAVEELDWLYWDWTEWTGAGRSRDAADWHDRWLPGVLARVAPDLARCTSGGGHLEPASQRAVPEDLKMSGYAPEQVYIERMYRAGGTPR